MTQNTPLRVLLITLFAALFASLASADIYVTATQNTGSSVAKRASVSADIEHADYPNAPANDMYLINAGTSNAELEVSIDTFTSKGTYFVGSVWDFSWVDYEDVYVTIN
jgi:hypothetical protein